VDEVKTEGLLILRIASLVFLGIMIMPGMIQYSYSQSPGSFAGNVILGRPTDYSISVQVIFPTNQDAIYMEYGEKSGEYGLQTPMNQSIKAMVLFVA
jgi:hypothetical protein